MTRALAVVTLLAVWGCGGGQVEETVAQQPEAIEARGIVDMLARGEVGALGVRVDESQRVPGMEEQLRAMAALFPRSEPTRVRVVDFQKRTVTVVGGSSTETCGITIESNYAEGNVFSQVLFQTDQGRPRRLMGLHASPLAAPLEVLNAFTLAGKEPIHYLFLVAMVAVAGLTVQALAAWVRHRKSIRRRWWWLAGILVGTFKISVDWTSGAVMVQALTIQLFSLSAVRRGLDGPWLLAFSIPAGAIAFLIVQHQRRLTATRPTRD